ncbi:hypothetical protein DRJ19_05780 [Candidatus Woesearchaeota archaeon]|nr:MAG: hypothetical protein DRJ19_05780 [Candidatus Woesearchaeota archaeon]
MFDGKVDTIETRWGYVLLELVVFNRAMSEEEALYLHRNRNSIDLLSRDDFVALVSYPTLKCGASPVPPAFTAKASCGSSGGSQLPHPMPLVKAWATLCPSLLLMGVIGNIPSFRRNSEYLNLSYPPLLAYPRFEKRGFASNGFIIVEE